MRRWVRFEMPLEVGVEAAGARDADAAPTDPEEQREGPPAVPLATIFDVWPEPLDWEESADLAGWRAPDEDTVLPD